MAAEPKPKAAAKKKRRRAAREEFVDYVVEIEGWDWGYSLSLNTEKPPVDPALKVMNGRNTERLSPRLRHNRCKVSTEDML